MMPGDIVAVSTTLAGRDPDEFASPDEIRFDRKPRYLSFGFGIHHCAGLHLARRQMRIAKSELLNRIPPSASRTLRRCAIVSPASSSPSRSI
jgi:cytochrome P450